jgi:hypothetical protein
MLSFLGYTPALLVCWCRLISFDFVIIRNHYIQITHFEHDTRFTLFHWRYRLFDWRFSMHLCHVISR